MGEVIDMRQYRLDRVTKRARAKGLSIDTASNLRAKKLEAMRRHPAGKGRHE